jgi:hypothetical protein
MIVRQVILVPAAPVRRLALKTWEFLVIRMMTFVPMKRAMALGPAHPVR